MTESWPGWPAKAPQTILQVIDYSHVIDLSLLLLLLLLDGFVLVRFPISNVKRVELATARVSNWITKLAMGHVGSSASLDTCTTLQELLIPTLVITYNLISVGAIILLTAPNFRTFLAPDLPILSS